MKILSIDNLKATELRLGLPGIEEPRGTKRASEGEDSPDDQDLVPVAKMHVVGWPPIRSYGKNNLRIPYVKVSMDGVPYLRKMDLKGCKGYKELREGLEDLFSCFSSDYAITYEDKEGDWMLVGDVPWGMFMSSCKRLRIMRGSEARGLDSKRTKE